MSNIKLSDVELVVASIPLGITTEGWKVLKRDRIQAIPLIEDCIKSCEYSIEQLNTTRISERITHIVYFNSCLKELNRIKEALENM